MTCPVPQVGDSVHLSCTEDPGDLACEVTHVSWANDAEYGGWHAELSVR